MAGEIFSHYEIVEKLGEGGMGVVYRARDTRLGREVALKFLPPHLRGSEEAGKRFVQEAKAASALDHPNICTIYEIDETDDGATFIAMALYGGRTLRERIDEGPLEPGEALDITRQISSGLARAHEAGIVHRDVKPSNIIITPDGLVKILDFGIAKLESATKLTREGSTLGTAAYISPEQATGSEAGPAADVWATGVILYEMLTGRKPFSGEHEAAVLYGIVHEEHPPLPDEVVRADSDIGRIIDKALAKDTAQRYGDSGEMRKAIEGLPGEKLRARSYSNRSTSGLFSKPVFRWGLVLALIAASVLVVLKYVGRGGDTSSGTVKIAVLPFANLGSPDDEYFSEGIAEEISNRLSMVRSVRVIARQSVIKYKNSPKSIRQIAEELGGLEYIVEGTIQRERPSDPTSRVRITPRLVSCSDGTRIWGDSYDEEMVGIFEIQSEIAAKVAEAIDVSLPTSGAKGGPAAGTADLRAFEFYLKGQALRDLNSYDDETALASREMFERALEIDPDYIDAMVALAVNSCWRAFQDRDSDIMLQSAKENIDRAMDLDPGNAGVYLARGTYSYVAYKDFEAALSDFRTAHRKNPSSVEVLNFLAWAERRLGKWEDARESFLKAKELDPSEVSLNFIIGEHLLWMRRYSEAQKYLDLARELDPDDMYNILGLIQLYLAVDQDVVRARELLYETLEKTGKDDILYVFLDNPTMQRILVFSDSLLVSRFAGTDRSQTLDALLYAEMYDQTGQMDLARAYYDSLRVLLEGSLDGLQEIGPAASTKVSKLGFTYARMGMKEKAIEYGELAVEILPVSRDAVQGVVHLEKLSMIYALTGEHDKAFELLDRLFAMPVSILLSPEIIKLDPLWDPIRDDPRFDNIVEKYSG